MSFAILRLETVDSTNELAKRMLADGRIRGRTAILAREQTAGRGTRERTWASPRDAGIYLSLADAGLALQPIALNDFSLQVGRACAELLREVLGQPVQLKPVNDLYLGGDKLGGILVETVIEGHAVRSLITGVGINTARAERRIDGSAVKPTSLEEHIPADRFAALNLPRLADRLAAALGRCHDELIRTGQSIKMTPVGIGQ